MIFPCFSPTPLGEAYSYGLRVTASNFDTVSFHALPNPRLPDELWPDLSEEEEKKRTEHLERVARDKPRLRLGKDDCGRFDLAGKSVAVPFVGATAASLVVAETVRLPHDGPAYFDIKLGLGDRAGDLRAGTETTRLKTPRD